MRFVEGPTLHQTIRQLHDEAGETRSRNFYYALGFRQLLQNLIALSNQHRNAASRINGQKLATPQPRFFFYHVKLNAIFRQRQPDEA